MSEADETNDPAADTEIAALLDFAPVPRKQQRRDGWTAERQRGFIATLAATGNRDGAAHAVGLTGRGAYELRRSAGAEPFANAWDDALALYQSRQPRPAAPTAGPRGRRAAPAPQFPPPPPNPPTDPEKEKAERRAFWSALLQKYARKVREERTARLEGRIAAADHAARQLSFIEIALDLGGEGHGALKILDSLRAGGCGVLEIAATPMSVLLDSVRRQIWREADEPERPPPPEIVASAGGISRAQTVHYNPARDGPDRDAWHRRQPEDNALAAEAQRLWEEKARADALAWRARIAQAGGAPE